MHVQIRLYQTPECGVVVPVRDKREGYNPWSYDDLFFHSQSDTKHCFMTVWAEFMIHKNTAGLFMQAQISDKFLHYYMILYESGF